MINTKTALLVAVLPAILFVCSFPFLSYAEEPTPALAALSQDEIVFVKEQFKTVTLDRVCVKLLIPAYAPYSGAVTGISHPDSELKKLVVAAVFNTADEFEKALFDAVYKEADAKNNNLRVWNPQGEGNFLRARLLDKTNADPKFLDVLLTALKATDKSLSKK